MSMSSVANVHFKKVLFSICIILPILFSVGCTKEVSKPAGLATAQAVTGQSTSNNNTSVDKPVESKPREAIVVVDPGHGGDDQGTYHGDMLEKNINLDISKRLVKLLKNDGINVVITRESDVFVGLKERAEMANNLDAALFISVHNNEMTGQPGYRGTETLYCPSPNTVEDKMNGKKLAAIVQKELVKTLKTIDNGIISRPNLAVLRRTKMPAVIAEIAYVSNPSDRARLDSAEFRQKAAGALARSVLKALEEMGASRDTSGKLMLPPGK
ncbi:MAG: N-acetylmuramoyl-L-alanine amidase [Clostridia bacterium]|nr:N-acetylmuramoyl-L-alanine amidase [Clostridia bacterium]